MNGLPNGVVESDDDKKNCGGMYSVKKPYVVQDVVTIPNVMYSVEPIHPQLSAGSSVSNSAHNISGSTSRGTFTGNKCPSNPSVEAMDNLEKRQIKIIEDLKELKETISKIHLKCVKSGLNCTTTAVESNSSLTVTRSTTETDQGSQFVTNENVDVVFFANPNKPPFSLLFFVNLFEQNYSNAVVSMKSHIHSSFQGTVNMDALSMFNQEKEGANFKFTLIWKNVEDCTMVVTPLQSSVIYGEANVARFLSRLLPNTNTSLNYDCLNWDILVKVDYLLDLSSSEQVNIVSIVEQELKKEKKNTFLTSQATISDLVLYSAVASKVISGQKNVPANVKTWFKNVEITFRYQNSCLH